MDASTLHGPNGLLKYQCINHMALSPTLSMKCFAVLENFAKICDLHFSLACDLEGSISRYLLDMPILLH